LRVSNREIQDSLDRITVLLGGRAAEALIFQEISTGARDDLQKASELARYMVTALGMSEQLGPYTVEGPQPMFLPNGAQPPQSYSEATAQTIAQATLARLLAGLPPTVQREPVALGPMQAGDGLNGSQNQTDR
jgi:cell division protease FtsH